MNRNGEAIVVDEAGREREHFKLVYGAILNLKDGAVTKSDKGVTRCRVGSIFKSNHRRSFWKNSIPGYRRRRDHGRASGCQ